MAEGPRMIWKVITAAGLLAACGLAAALAPVPAGNQPWITLKGRVLLPKEKTVVAPLVNVGVDKDHCLSKGPLFDEAVIVDAKTRGLKNVWVYLRPDDDDVKAVIQKEKIHPNLLKPKPVEHTVDHHAASSSPASSPCGPATRCGTRTARRFRTP